MTTFSKQPLCRVYIYYMWRAHKRQKNDAAKHDGCRTQAQRTLHALTRAEQLAIVRGNFGTVRT